MSGVFDVDGAIRRIPNHPHPGILFYDLMPLFQEPAGLDACVRGLSDWARPLAPDAVVGIEARGLILGGALAHALGVGLAAARKPGKLPGERIQAEYELEYGTDTLELHRDAVRPGDRVVVHDDLLATGGTADAVCRLVERLGGVVVGVGVVAELTFLPGRERLAGRSVHSLVRFDSEAL
ncbi:MAG TPA: adenine phosphoribosyltransferase [Miltoncostaeaceae bacterium]|nr:adenine phosphoribosyltransferase [Miltoncostaeaceae bacterium]